MKAARAGAIGVPTLVIHGGDDRLVPTTSSEPLARQPGVERVVFPEFRHESFNEDGGTEALRVVTDWIKAQLAQRSA
jgi:alpha-beta hydrolase superfamily lysophospholipase